MSQDPEPELAQRQIGRTLRDVEIGHPKNLAPGESAADQGPPDTDFLFTLLLDQISKMEWELEYLLFPIVQF